jgi:hypothetical protein
MAVSRKQLIAQLYVLMSTTYGHLFSSVNKSDADVDIWINIWMDALADLSDVQIHRGQSRMAKEYGSAPTPKEFRAICKITSQEAVNRDEQNTTPRLGYQSGKKDWRELERVKWLNKHPEFKANPANKEEASDLIKIIVKFLDSTGTPLPYSKDSKLAGKEGSQSVSQPKVKRHILNDVEYEAILERKALDEL